MTELKVVTATEYALEKVKNEGLPIKTAALQGAQFQGLDSNFIDRIRKRVQRQIAGRDHYKRPKLLGDEENQFLVDLVKSFSESANPLTSGDIRTIAQAIGNLPSRPTTGWLRSWLKANSDSVSYRKGKKSHKKSILLASLTKVQKWTDETTSILEKLSLKAHLVFNIDETKAIPKPKYDRLIASNSSTECQYQDESNSTLYTLVSCISADGTTLFNLYIFKLTQTKSGPRNIIFTPAQDISPLKKSEDFPIYVALSPGGYMNKELWSQTMFIFCELAGYRQGLGQTLQAVLFLDGCSSHDQAATTDLLAEKNIATIFFPANSSHILQPLDGATFANYKRGARHEQHKTLLEHSMTDLPTSHRSLLNSITAYYKTVTKSVNQASFSKRGIWPWNPNLITANTMAASPKSKLVACPEEVRQTLMSDQVISTIRDMLKNTTPVKKGLITKVNKPTLLQNTPEWTRAPRTKPAQKKVLQLESPESFESEDYDSSSHSDELNEDYFELPPIEPSPFATNCDHCERHSTTAKVELACVYCEELFLCFSCKSDPKIIQDHMKKHQNDEGRATRKRKRC